MKKILLLIIFLITLCNADRWTGFGDTTGFRDTMVSGTDYFGSAIYELGSFSNIIAVIKVDDTTQAGFASDSVQFNFGFQLGTFSSDSGDLKDTVWVNRKFHLDSFVTSKYGSSADSIYFSDDWYWQSTTDNGLIDTTNLNGYAYICYLFKVPFFAHLIRYFINPLSGHAAGYANEIWIEHQEMK